MAVAGVPLARGQEQFEAADVRVAAVAFVALIAAIVRGWAWLVPASIALVGGSYAAELAIDDVPLDAAAPIVAIGLLLASELAYWSLDERDEGCPTEALPCVADRAVALVERPVGELGREEKPDCDDRGGRVQWHVVDRQLRGVRAAD